MNHYKSWSGLKKQLSDSLCEELKDRITYFLTRYHNVHNSYGRAAIRLDGKELAVFSWTELYQQDQDINERWEETGDWNVDVPELKAKWDAQAVYSDWNFLDAATEFLQMPIAEALRSDIYLIRIFAILDRRVGKRTWKKIRDEGAYLEYPQWVRQFYELRMEVMSERDT